MRLRWGDRSLEAEVVDGRGKKVLSLGDREEDDFVVGGGVRLRFEWRPTGLGVTFSTGVSGTASLRGDAPTSLGALIERGVVKEGPDGFQLELSGDDVLTLQVAEQILEVRRAKGRVARLRIDVLATLALIAALVLLAMWVGTTAMGMTPLNLLGPAPAQKSKK